MKKSVLSLTLAVLLFAGCSPTNQEKSQGDENTEAKVAAAATTEETSKPVNNNSTMYPALSNYIQSVVTGMEVIPQERKNQLKKLALFVQTKKQSSEPANLTFICTHNSRRSHMSQIWAATAAAYYGVEAGFHTFSGGTEATAFNPRAVAAIERAGFKVDNPGGKNPQYKVTYNENGQVMECFSKKYDDPANASENFAAVMTCSEADKNCPFIPGASLRVPIPYVDPKEADGTDQEAATNDVFIKHADFQ
ncbi:MAG: protein-tyrosine-phosphatase [Cyclobacteriaceae bacterium]